MNKPRPGAIQHYENPSLEAGLPPREQGGLGSPKTLTGLWGSHFAQSPTRTRWRDPVAEDTVCCSHRISRNAGAGFFPGRLNDARGLRRQLRGIIINRLCQVSPRLPEWQACCGVSHLLSDWTPDPPHRKDAMSGATRVVKPVSREVTVPGREAAAVVLLNGHRVPIRLSFH